MVEKEESGDLGKRPKRKGFVKCKGLKGYVSARARFEELENCLFTEIPVYKSQNTLRNRGQRMYVERQTKKAFCEKDDKRHIMPNKVDTLPWGHYSLREPQIP